MRWLALVLCFSAACKKSALVEENRSKTDPMQDASPTPDANQGLMTPKPKDASIDGPVAAPDAHAMGGDNSPAHVDSGGHPHGPGGPVFMGVGPDCDAAHNHCMRPDTWFAADNVIAGKLFRALPVYQLEGKWYDWREGEERTGRFFHTKLATIATVHKGDTLVFFNTAQPPQWVNSEYEALTSSNWEVGVVESVNPGAKTFKIQGWDDNLAIDAGRVIAEQK